MSKFTKEMVNSYAEKLLIGLTAEENRKVLEEFDIIDKKCDIVNSIPNINKIEPMTHCLDNFETILREDITKQSVSTKELLANCKNVKENEIEIPKVVGK